MIKVDILGEQYKLLEIEDKRFEEEDADGFCEWWAKELHIRKGIDEPEQGSMLNLKDYRINTIKHEVVHAFMFESGMKNYERDEMLIEWIARNLDRMMVACGQALQVDNDN